jgi:hypothetical protein
MVDLDRYYFSYFEHLYDKLKTVNFYSSFNDLFSMKLTKIKLNPGINEEAYDNLKDSSKYIEYPGLIKYQSDEYYPGLFGFMGYRRCISKGTWSGDPIVNFYECYRPDIGISTFRFGTNVTLSKHTGFNHKMKIDLITQKINSCLPFFSSKHIICISLLSPGKKTGSQRHIMTALGRFYPKIAVTAEEPKILDRELSKSSQECTFISFPLSSNKKSGLTLFDYEKMRKDINKDDLSKQFYDLINISTAEYTFKSIVDIAELFYNKFKDSHVLAYHCKSGKDRTSLFDSVVQATFYYMKNNGGKKSYKDIKLIARKFMMFGFLIGYYGTGYFGLKLGSNRKLSEYILGSSLYNFYFGHAGLAKSSM